MARAAVAVQTLTANAANSLSGGVAISNANGHYVACRGDTRNVVFVIHNTAPVGTVAVKAGAYTYPSPTWTQGYGDLSVVCPGTADTYFVVESARFAQPIDSVNSYPAGAIYLDTPSPLAGTVFAFLVPQA